MAIDLLAAGPEFEKKLVKYVRPMVIKGVPATVNELAHLYKNEKKKRIIEELFLSMCKQMEKDMTLSQGDEEE